MTEHAQIVLELHQRITALQAQALRDSETIALLSAKNEELAARMERLSFALHSTQAVFEQELLAMIQFVEAIETGGVDG